MNLIPLTAAGGNSRAARSLRARLQWRDRYGRWIEMGRGVDFDLRLPDGRIISAIGAYVGPEATSEKEAEFGWVRVQGERDIPDGFYKVSSGNAQEALAGLSADYLEEKGIVPGQDADGQTIGKRLDADIQNLADIERADAPPGWAKNEDGSYSTEDGDYTIRETGEGNTVTLEDNRADVDNKEEPKTLADWGDAMAEVTSRDAKADLATQRKARQEAPPADPDAWMAKDIEGLKAQRKTEQDKFLRLDNPNSGAGRRLEENIGKIEQRIADYEKNGEPAADEPVVEIPDIDAPEAPKAISSLNPSDSGVFEDYESGREYRATAPLADNMTSLAETEGVSPDDEVTLYRGAPEGASADLQPGDFVTTNRQLAQDYAGTGEVTEHQARYGDVLDDKDEPGGEEYIYRPGADAETGSEASGTEEPVGAPVADAPVADAPAVDNSMDRANRLFDALEGRAPLSDEDAATSLADVKAAQKAARDAVNALGERKGQDATTAKNLSSKWSEVANAFGRETGSDEDTLDDVVNSPEAQERREGYAAMSEDELRAEYEKASTAAQKDWQNRSQRRREANEISAALAEKKNAPAPTEEPVEEAPATEERDLPEGQEKFLPSTDEIRDEERKVEGPGPETQREIAEDRAVEPLERLREIFADDYGMQVVLDSDNPAHIREEVNNSELVSALERRLDRKNGEDYTDAASRLKEIDDLLDEVDPASADEPAPGDGADAPATPQEETGAGTPQERLERGFENDQTVLDALASGDAKKIRDAVYGSGRVKELESRLRSDDAEVRTPAQRELENIYDDLADVTEDYEVDTDALDQDIAQGVPDLPEEETEAPAAPEAPEAPAVDPDAPQAKDFPRTHGKAYLMRVLKEEAYREDKEVMREIAATDDPDKIEDLFFNRSVAAGVWENSIQDGQDENGFYAAKQNRVRAEIDAMRADPATDDGTDPADNVSPVDPITPEDEAELREAIASGDEDKIIEVQRRLENLLDQSAAPAADPEAMPEGVAQAIERNQSAAASALAERRRGAASNEPLIPEDMRELWDRFDPDAFADVPRNVVENPSAIYRRLVDRFPGARIMPNGDIAIHSFTRDGKNHEILVRRTKNERFRVYLAETDPETGKVRVTPSSMERHSYRALINDARSALTLQASQDVDGWWERRQGARKPSYVNPDFFADARVDGFDYDAELENPDERGFAHALQNALADNAAPNSIIDALQKKAGLNTEARERILNMVLKNIVRDAQNGEPARTDTHRDRNGLKVKEGDKVFWTDRKTGMVWEGVVGKMLDSERPNPEKKANYVYKDYVNASFPAYDRWYNSLTPEERKALNFKSLHGQVKVGQQRKRTTVALQIADDSTSEPAAWNKAQEEVMDQEQIGPRDRLIPEDVTPEAPVAKRKKPRKPAAPILPQEELLRPGARIEAAVRAPGEVLEGDYVLGPDGNLRPAPKDNAVNIRVLHIEHGQGEAPAADPNAKPEAAVAGIIGEITKNPVKPGENRPALRRIVEKIRRPRYWRQDDTYGAYEVRVPTDQEIRRDFVRTRKYDTVEGTARVGDIVKTNDGSILQVVQVSAGNKSARYRVLKTSPQADLYLPQGVKVGDTFARRHSQERSYHVFAPKTGIADDYFRPADLTPQEKAAQDAPGDAQVAKMQADMEGATPGPVGVPAGEQKGIQNALARRVVAADGTEYFQKGYKPGVDRTGVHAKDALDAEVLSGTIAVALGIPDAGVIEHTFGDGAERRIQGAIIMQARKPVGYAELLQTFKDQVKIAKPDADMKAFGVLDFLIANKDRHGSNWMQNNEGRLRPIDHGLANFRAPLENVPKISNSPFTQAILGDILTGLGVTKGRASRAGVRQPAGGTPKISAEELRGMRDNMSVPSVWADFEGRGRTEWYNTVMTRLNMLIRMAEHLEKKAEPVVEGNADIAPVV